MSTANRSINVDIDTAYKRCVRTQNQTNNSLDKVGALPYSDVATVDIANMSDKMIRRNTYYSVQRHTDHQARFEHYQHALI
jgi:hypothetical protein